MGDNESAQDKPRRLEDETADYLAKIELQFTDAALDQEDKINLVDNVLSEINQRTASAACDRRTNYLIEKFCYAADLKNLLIITRRFIPYAVFLARNRYSSHLIQVWCSMLSTNNEKFTTNSTSCIYFNMYIAGNFVQNVLHLKV